MRRICVSTAQPYDILIGQHLLSQAGALIDTHIHPHPAKIVVVADDTVDGLYGQAVLDSLAAAGFACVRFVFPHGEDAKSLDTAGMLYRFLSAHAITRGDLLVALGGGVTGDLCGFAAATWLRGILYVQMPTTLLAMVDSSVGGKTAVNIPQGKNLVGAFWQPRLVLCDTHTLSTLSPDIFRDGLAEALKYGALYDEALFCQLSDGEGVRDPQALIARCVDLKRMAVESDERDTGARQLLNFGHTLGHAIEKMSGFSVSHGSAVGIGMAEITARTEASGLTAPGTYARIVRALEHSGMQSVFGGDVRTLIPAMLGDKKRQGGMLSFVVLDKIGSARLHTIRTEEIEAFLAHPPIPQIPQGGVIFAR